MSYFLMKDLTMEIISCVSVLNNDNQNRKRRFLSNSIKMIVYNTLLSSSWLTRGSMSHIHKVLLFYFLLFFFALWCEISVAASNGGDISPSVGSNVSGRCKGKAIRNVTENQKLKMSQVSEFSYITFFSACLFWLFILIFLRLL